MRVQTHIDRLLRRAAGDLEVLAVLLFGSTARGEGGAQSDVDVCVVLTAATRSRTQLERKRMAYLGDVDLDVQVFQSLPLYIRTRVLREGRVLFCRDEDALYDTAFATVRAFERLLQIAVECLIDVCQLFVSGLRLGLPAAEEDLFDKLEAAGRFTPETVSTLRRMRGCRNILVHEYGRVSDEIVFDTIGKHVADFDHFAGEVLDALR